MSYVIGVDGGTESLRAGVFDLSGKPEPWRSSLGCCCCCCLLHAVDQHWVWGTLPAVCPGYVTCLVDCNCSVVPRLHYQLLVQFEDRTTDTMMICSASDAMFFRSSLPLFKQNPGAYRIICIKLLVAPAIAQANPWLLPAARILQHFPTLRGQSKALRTGGMLWGWQ